MAPPRKIPSEEWERHKGTILRLRFDEKLAMKANSTTKRSLMQVMQDEHQFYATASQYEAKIKAWGAAKNLKKRDWETILPVYDDLHARGLKPRLRVGEYIFEENKVKRARREYFQTRNGAREIPMEPSTSLDPRCLWRIDIQEENGEYTEWRGRNEANNNHSLEDLSFSYQNQRDLHDGPVNVRNTSLRLDAPWNTPAVSIANAPNDELGQYFSCSNSPPYGLESTEVLISSVLEPYLVPHTLPTDSNICPLLSRQESTIRLPVYSKVPTSLGPPKMLLRDEVGSILRSIPQHCLQSRPGTVDTIGCDQWFSSITDRIVSLPSENIFGEGSMGLKLISGGSGNAQELCSRFIYSLTNNFAGLGYLERSTIFTILKLAPAMKSYLLRCLNFEKSFITKTLAINLFRSAIEAGEEEVFDMILKTTRGTVNEIDLNEIFTFRNWGRVSAIGLASCFLSVRIVETLLAHGAKVRVSAGEKVSVCALQQMIQHRRSASDSQSEGDLIRIFKLLTSNGPDDIINSFRRLVIDVQRFPYGFRSGIPKPLNKIQNKIVEIVFDSISREHYFRLATCTVEGDNKDSAQKDRLNRANMPLIRHIVYMLESRVAERILKALLKVDQSAGFQSSLAQECCYELKEALVQALMNANFGLVECLLEHTKLDETHLVAAIRSGRPQLIDSILAKGVCARGGFICHKHMINVYARDLFHPIIAPAFSCPRNNHDEGFCIPTTPLAEAIYLQNPVLVSRLENRGALDKINEKDSFHFLAAVYALSDVDNFSYLKQLLKLGPRLTLEILAPCIESAVKSNKFDIAWDLIISIPERENPRSHSRGQAMMIFSAIIRQGNLEFFETVLEYWNCFGDIDLLNFLLKVAVESGDKSIVEYLLQQGVTSSLNPVGCYDEGRDKNFSTADGLILNEAIKGKNLELVRLLLEWGAHPTGLHLAVKTADETLLHLMLNCGADPADDTAFVSALETKNESMLSILISHFCSRYPDGKKGFGGTALVNACLSGSSSTLELFIRAKFDINSHASKHRHDSPILPLVIEAFDQSSLALYQILNQLLDAGADQEAFTPENSRGEKGKTALLAAVSSNNLRVVELLLSRGADVNRPAQRGLKRTPLQQACEGGCIWMIEYILDAGADIHAPPAVNSGATALQLAAIQGNVDIVRLLLDRGAMVHEAPAKVHGRTALQGAAENGRVSVVDLLLIEGGAGYKLDDIKSAKKYAAENGHRGCVDRLELARFRLGTNPAL